MVQESTGWINNPRLVREYLDERQQQGQPARIAAAKPELSGFWRQTVESGIYAVLLYEAEKYLQGQYAPAIYQRRGTCVMQGTFRAIETGYWWAIRKGVIVANSSQIVSETIYAGGRVNVGKGQLGASHHWGCNCGRCPDGLVGAWAAKYVHDYGVLARGVYGEYDLTTPREDLAIAWAAPQRGVPSELLTASATHRCDAYHIGDGPELADVIAAGYGAAVCSTHRQADRRDENGECGYAGSTAHCESFTGVYLRPSWDGRPETIYDHTGFVDQQSWGNVPAGPDILRIYRGTAQLRQGAYGTPMRAVRSRLATGETWAFQLRDGFRASSLQEAV